MIRLLFALACCLPLVTGCSMVRLGYSQADNIALWTADEYFDLDAQQRQEFLARFERFYEWHRYEQLPEYADFLDTARNRLQRGLKPEDVDWFVEGLKARYRLVVNRAATDAAEILSSLTPAQLDTLQRQWDKDNRKFIREHRLEDDTEERKRARAARTLKQIRDWTGSLSYEQERKITAMLDDLPLIDHLRHQDRLRRQREFLQLLEKRGNKSEFPAKLRHWLLDWEQNRAPEYARQLNHWWGQRVQFFIEVDRMLTPHQRAIVLRRLQDYVEDFRKLSQRAARAVAVQ
ncbi:MAG: DUF6279 family lipoprotein [Burkholderiales bacterium]